MRKISSEIREEFLESPYEEIYKLRKSEQELFDKLPKISKKKQAVIDNFVGLVIERMRDDEYEKQQKLSELKHKKVRL